MIPTAKLERLLDRFHAVEAELASGVAGGTYVKLSKEHAELAPGSRPWRPIGRPKSNSPRRMRW